MTTNQEAENVAASVRHLLTQRGKDAENWQRQAKDWKRIAEQRRAELADLLTDVRAIIAQKDDLARQLAEAQRRIAELAGEKKLGDFFP